MVTGFGLRIRTNIILIIYSERKCSGMKKLMKKLWEKKDSKKGFTLVELIVVLVILAILMAILVPTLTAWIDKAKNKQITLNARTVLMAAQSAQAEAYGKSPSDVAEDKDVKAYLNDKEIKGTWKVTVSKDLKTVTKFQYNESGFTVTYENGIWSDPEAGNALSDTVETEAASS